METLHFNNLLLKTAFSCMACDGDIDEREVDLIKNLHTEKKIFGEIDVEVELESLLNQINKDSKQFFKKFFDELKNTALSVEDELKLIEVAIDTIKADDKVEYSEVKFFKVIRSRLKIKDEPILQKHPDFEDYLEQDIISDNYLAGLIDDFFDSHVSSELELMSKINLDDLKDNNEE